MTESGETTSLRVNSTRILGVIALLAIAISLKWLVARGRPSMEASQIQECRTMYAAARSHTDTLRVDNHLFPGTNPGGRGSNGGPAFNKCGFYRAKGRI